MSKKIPKGVWPTMITPFTDDNTVDYTALEQLIEWYLKADVDGLFAVCQSSEMFFLSMKERQNIARFVVDKVNGRVPVVASGNISNTISEQVDEMKRMSETGIDAAVLVPNRFAKQDESEDTFKLNIEKFLDLYTEDVALGIYECPYPYKRLVSPELLKWCSQSQRFIFLKDTSCNILDIKSKIKALEGTEFKVYNANTATLLESLDAGGAGYSGIMANFLPELYVWLFRNRTEQYEKTKNLQNFLGMIAPVENRSYPICAKHFLQLEGLGISLNTRTKDVKMYTPSFMTEIEQLHTFSKKYKAEFGLLDDTVGSVLKK